MKYVESSANGKREILDEFECLRECYEVDKCELCKCIDDIFSEKFEMECEKFVV